MENTKKIPIKFIKYEKLTDQTYVVFKEIIEFINELTRNKEKVNISKLKNALNSTSFSKLKKDETELGFSEAVNSQKNRDKKIKFFNLRPENDWRKVLDRHLQEKLTAVFNKDLDELSYF